MKRILCSLALCAVPFLSACKKSGEAGSGDQLTIAFLPKSKGNQYFVTCEKGARAAAADLGAELLFDGPTNSDPAKQNEIVENWISLGVDVIAAACENKDGLSTALRKAQAAGSQADYRVVIDIQRFESAPGDAATIEALWTVLPLKGKSGALHNGRSLAREPVQSPDYDALVAAHGRARASISRDIAQAVRAARVTQ